MAGRRHDQLLRGSGGRGRGREPGPATAARDEVGLDPDPSGRALDDPADGTIGEPPRPTRPVRSTGRRAGPARGSRRPSSRHRHHWVGRLATAADDPDLAPDRGLIRLRASDPNPQAGGLDGRVLGVDGVQLSDIKNVDNFGGWHSFRDAFAIGIVGLWAAIRIGVLGPSVQPAAGRSLPIEVIGAATATDDASSVSTGRSSAVRPRFRLTRS